MADIFDSLKKGTELVRSTVRQTSSELLARTRAQLELQRDPLAMGMVFLMEKMSALMDHSFQLIESQLEESRLQQEVLELEKELLRKKLANEEGKNKP
ncbi:MAG: hypothetical protein KC609_25315 [Myxococcales bacterium]|nr:hypothetical protein [Myxococcales bacterium]